MLPYSSAPAPQVQRLSTVLGPTSEEVVADPMCWGERKACFVCY